MARRFHDSGTVGTWGERKKYPQRESNPYYENENLAC
jgi:hypothetical protein